MSLFITILVTFFAGMGAGLGTGFAGMSAAAVISPMLITFLGMDPYMAVGIALSQMFLPVLSLLTLMGKTRILTLKMVLLCMSVFLHLQLSEAMFPVLFLQLQWVDFQYL